MQSVIVTNVLNEINNIFEDSKHTANATGTASKRTFFSSLEYTVVKYHFMKVKLPSHSIHLAVLRRASYCFSFIYYPFVPFLCYDQIIIFRLSP